VIQRWRLLAVMSGLSAALAACGGGARTASTTASSTQPTRTTLAAGTPSATQPTKSTFAPPLSGAEILRRLSPSCRRQLLDPRTSPSLKNRMFRDYQRELTLHPDAGRHMFCGNFFGK